MCFPINVSVCVVCFMFLCVGEFFVVCVCYCVGEVIVFSLKVIVLFLLASPCIVFQEGDYVCCVCDLSMCLGVPSICQICVYVYEGCDCRV